MIRVILEAVGSIFLILFGVLFLLYLPLSLSEIATDAIFIGAGALFMRKAIQDRRLELARAKTDKKLARKNQRADARKRKQTS
jgi:hypothetical protein